VFGLGPATRIYLAAGVTDMRKGFESLDAWVLKVGELLMPMVAAMKRELISGSYIQTDEIPVDVQMHEGRDSSDGVLA